MLPPFTLYGLMGCSHCASAEAFLRSRNLPFMLIVANEDPVINEGVKKLTGSEEYPVLLCKFNKEIVKGFKQEEYERVAKAFYAFNSPSAPSLFSGEQQSQPQASSPVSPSQPA